MYLTGGGHNGRNDGISHILADVENSLVLS